MKRVVLGLLLLVACGGDPTEPPPPPPPAPPQPPPPPPPITVWSQDPRSSVSGVELRAVSVTEERLELEAHVRGVDVVYGVAFRLGFDPEVLELESAEPIGDWGPTYVARAVPRAGLLVAGFTLSGNNLHFFAGPEDPLFRVAFRRLDPRRASAVAFVRERTAMVLPYLEMYPGVEWTAGALVAPE